MELTEDMIEVLEELSDMVQEQINNDLDNNDLDKYEIPGFEEPMEILEGLNIWQK